jgi:Raffinose synthase or seed imbibition protein Sip1
MSHSPRHLIGPHALSHSKEIRPMRSSNDYFPSIPSSHAYHVYTNVYASQFLSCFSIADFDMFQTHESNTSSSTTSGKQGPFHASLRALGNGPVTVTDVPGHCDSTVFKRLVGQARDGKTIALNGTSPLGLMDERCFDEVMHGGDGEGLRGYCKSEWGVMMGIWNVREGGSFVRDTISMTDAADVPQAQRVVCWSHALQEVFFLTNDSKREIFLKELEFEVLTFVAMSQDIVCLGLVDKYNTLAAIQTHDGNAWTFKCLGQAVWVVSGHRRVKVKVEETEVSTSFWTMEDVTIVKAGLTDYSETASVSEPFWAVKVVFY